MDETAGERMKQRDDDTNDMTLIQPMFKDHRASKMGKLLWYLCLVGFKKTCFMKEQTFVLKGVKIMMKKTSIVIMTL